MRFIWKRELRKHHGVVWCLFLNGQEIGTCFFLPGSRQYRCQATAPATNGSVITYHYAGTAAAARRRLEQEWDRRSIGLFGVDQIEFVEAA